MTLPHPAGVLHVSCQGCRVSARHEKRFNLGGVLGFFLSHKHVGISKGAALERSSSATKCRTSDGSH